MNKQNIKPPVQFLPKDFSLWCGSLKIFVKWFMAKMSHIESIIVAILTYLVSNASQPLFRRAEIHLGFLQQLLNSLQRRLHVLLVPLPSLEAGIGALACSETGLNLTWFPSFSRRWGDGRHVTLDLSLVSKLGCNWICRRPTWPWLPLMWHESESGRLRVSIIMERGH